VQRVIDVAVDLTLLVAGCSLAVAIGGGLVERKRAFTLMRVSGTPKSTLYRVVLLEAAFPLVAATIVAAGTAYGISVLAIDRLGSQGTPLPVLGGSYYLSVAAGLLASLAVIAVALPLLGRMTAPASARFE
jgi:ABC-type antimicrobial peptide transport system permease subunit